MTNWMCVCVDSNGPVVAAVVALEEEIERAAVAALVQRRQLVARVGHEDLSRHVVKYRSDEDDANGTGYEVRVINGNG
jgi:hypothetical protein